MFSTRGDNLTFSLILKKPQDTKLSLFSILSGISIVRGIKKFTNIKCTLKWPNDIILNNKKIGGILIENKNDSSFFVIGIGLNINQQEIPNELKNIASSLRIEKTNPIQREPLLAFILNEFENLYDNNPLEWITQWKMYCDHLNKKVTFNNHGIQGTFIDINESGNAIIDTQSKKIVIPSGVLKIL